MLLCRGIPAQHSKALSCWWQVETARRDRKGKSYADVNLDRMNVSSIYALHLTTNVYIYIYVCAGEEAGARNLAFSRVKWLQPAMKSSSCVCGGCGWDRSDGFFLPHCNCGFKLLWMRLCVRRYRVFWNLWLQIAVACMLCCHVRRYMRVCHIML